MRVANGNFTRFCKNKSITSESTVKVVVLPTPATVHVVPTVETILCKLLQVLCNFMRDPDHDFYPVISADRRNLPVHYSTRFNKEDWGQVRS